MDAAHQHRAGLAADGAASRRWRSSLPASRLWLATHPDARLPAHRRCRSLLTAIGVARAAIDAPPAGTCYLDQLSLAPMPQVIDGACSAAHGPGRGLAFAACWAPSLLFAQQPRVRWSTRRWRSWCWCWAGWALSRYIVRRRAAGARSRIWRCIPRSCFLLLDAGALTLRPGRRHRASAGERRRRWRAWRGGCCPRPSSCRCWRAR